MFDGIFFINHALCVKQLSQFTNEERFEQTIQTLDSIDRHCPNSMKFIFDSSPEKVPEHYLESICSRENTWFLEIGQNPIVKPYSEAGLRSLAETASFMIFLDWFTQQEYKAKRIYKLSGRYQLTDDFVVDAPEYEGAFVFANALDSWMDEATKKHVGVDKLYRLRCWHMDYDLLNTFMASLPKVFQDCKEHGIDVEHSYYKNLHTSKVVELDKIGVTGYIAPSGEYINE